MTLTIADLRTEAEKFLIQSPEGDSLDPFSHALIDLGVKAAVTSLDIASLDDAIATALDAGATRQQVQEIIALVSGLGVHSLMTSARRLLEKTAATDDSLRGPLSAEQQALWTRYIGDDSYWISFEEEVPGFLDALLRLSPDLFRSFHDYCAIPWKSGTVPARIKELAAMAADATQTHRFLPGMRLHLRNALKLGAGRKAVVETLDIAAAAPGHGGVR